MSGKEDLKAIGTATARSAAIPDSVSSRNSASLKRPPPPAVEDPVDAGAAVTGIEPPEPRRMATRARTSWGVQSFIKQEDVPEGNVQCPVCFQIICSAEKGCNVVTCRNHQPQFVYFCVHCKKVNENSTEYAICDCPKRNTRTTRAQAQAERNNLARANPIEIELSSSSDNEEKRPAEDEKSLDTDDDSSYDGDEVVEEESDEDNEIPARKKRKKKQTALIPDDEGKEKESEEAKKIPARKQRKEIQTARKNQAPLSEDEEKESEEDKKIPSRKQKMKTPLPRTKPALVPVFVEFKFASRMTELFKADDLLGRIHIRLDQDPRTGKYRIPLGMTTFQVFFDKEETGGIWRAGLGFSGEINRSDSGKIAVDPNLVLDYTVNKVGRWGPGVSVQRGQAFGRVPAWDESDFSAEGKRFRRWERDQGGLWQFTAKAAYKWLPDYCHSINHTDGTYKIKLYTVLSAHKPEEKDPLKLYEKGYAPDWQALVSLVFARASNKSKAWAMRAVGQYKLFLDLKADQSLVGIELSPSKAIHKIWRAHLSFVERYQKDILALTKGKRIIQHLPVHEDGPDYYAVAHKEHSKRMKERGLPIDEEFWPEPVDAESAVSPEEQFSACVIKTSSAAAENDWKKTGTWL